MLQRPRGLEPLNCRPSASPPSLQRRCVSSTSSCSARQLRHAPNSRTVSCSAAGGPDSTGSSSGGQPSVSVADPAQPNAAAGTGNSSSSGGSTPDKSALLARVAAAKAAAQAYKSGGSTSSSTNSSTDAQQQPQSTEEPQLTEEQQEAMRQQYLQTLQQQQQELASQNSAYNSFLQTTSSSSSSSSSGSSALDRLRDEDPGWGPGSKTGPARADFYTSADAPEVQQLLQSAPKRDGTGSADEAADWLKGVLQDTGKPMMDPNMRLEDFTLAQEAAAKQRGAEIITAFPEDFASSSSSSSGTAAAGEPAADAAAADGSAAAAPAAGQDADEDGKYKPKVTTWGVFPRPQNISATYGGGRNIRPGQDLETPQQKAEREAQYAAALAKYKKAVHTDTLSDAELAEAQARFSEGMKLFKRGRIDQALIVFDEVRAKVPLKSKLGGLSTLQAAVCYDTLGNGRQAEALYKRIQGHPTTEVGRKARQLVFGFQAMTFLKTQDLNYAVKKEDYIKYFRRSADRTRIYVASEEEKAADAAEARKSALIAAGIVLGPVLMMGAMLVK